MQMKQLITRVKKLNFLRKLRQWSPSKKEIQEYRYIHIFGDTLKQPELWTFNRTSSAKGIAIGLFCAFLPMPFEMIPAIFIATALGGNLPLAMIGIWLSNPVTWIPLYTPCYFLGAKIIGLELIPISQISILELGWHYVALWLGCLIIGSVVALTSHFLISYIWATQVRQRWSRRRTSRIERERLKKQGISL